jgi:hypothetical protein
VDDYWEGFVALHFKIKYHNHVKHVVEDDWEGLVALNQAHVSQSC